MHAAGRQADCVSLPRPARSRCAGWRIGRGWARRRGAPCACEGAGSAGPLASSFTARRGLENGRLPPSTRLLEARGRSSVPGDGLLDPRQRSLPPSRRLAEPLVPLAAPVSRLPEPPESASTVTRGGREPRRGSLLGLGFAQEAREAGMTLARGREEARREGRPAEGRSGRGQRASHRSVSPGARRCRIAVTRGAAGWARARRAGRSSSGRPSGPR